MSLRGLSKNYPTFIFPSQNKDDSAPPLYSVKEDTFMRMWILSPPSSASVAACGSLSEVLHNVDGEKLATSSRQRPH